MLGTGPSREAFEQELLVSHQKFVDTRVRQ